MGFPLHRPYPYSLYRWGFLHFRHLKCLVIDGLCAIFKSPSYFLSSRACESCEGLATPYHPWDWYIHPYIGLILMVHIWHIYHTWIQWAILSGFSHHTCFWSRHLMSRCFAGESKNRPGTLASESYRVCRFDICICTLQGINISHLGKRKLIFKNALVGDMLIPRRVSQFSQLKLNHWKKNWHKKKNATWMLSPSKISTMLFALNNKTSWNWTHIWSPERRKRKHKTKHIQTHQTQTTNMSKLYNLLISSRFRFFF